MEKTANRLRNVGRPTDLTPEVQETICDAIRAGNYLEPSAALAGVSKATVYNWIKRGGAEKKRLSKSKRARVRKKEAIYVEFVDAIREADAIAEARDVATISLAAEKHWGAAAWRLSRKHHDRWGDKRTNIHEGGENPIRAEVVQYPVNKRDEPKE
jgi:transposase